MIRKIGLASCTLPPMTRRGGSLVAAVRGLSAVFTTGGAAIAGRLPTGGTPQDTPFGSPIGPQEPAHGGPCSAAKELSGPSINRGVPCWGEAGSTSTPGRRTTAPPTTFTTVPLGG